MDAIELLTTTKAVRRRIDFDRPVPYELLEECVEIAVKAPLGGDEWQPHFLIVDDREGWERWQPSELPARSEIRVWRGSRDKILVPQDG